MEKQLETLEFGISELAMLISNVLSSWRNKNLLEVFQIWSRGGDVGGL
jgi:hypothetical protein